MNSIEQMVKQMAASGGVSELTVARHIAEKARGHKQVYDKTLAVIRKLEQEDKRLIASVT